MMMMMMKLMVSEYLKVMWHKCEEIGILCQSVCLLMCMCVCVCGCVVHSVFQCTFKGDLWVNAPAIHLCTPLLNFRSHT